MTGEKKTEERYATIQLQGIKKIYHIGGEELAALNGITTNIYKGEFAALMGPSGSGKSTLMNILGCLDRPTEGSYKLDGEEVAGLDDDALARTRNKKIGFVFQNFNLLSRISALENVALPLIYAGVGHKERMERAMHFLEAVGLKDRADHLPNELSGGQRTKVLLTKLLLENPEILLLDEPTNYLDAEHIEWLKNYLTNYENAFIVISHDVPFLNAVTNVIWHVDNLKLTRYTGSYEKFEEMAALKRRQEEAAYERQQAEIKREQDFIQRNKARVATRGMANSRQKKLDKMEVLTKRQEKPKPHFHFQSDRTPSRFVIEAQRLVLGYDTPLTKPVDIKVERNKKIAIRGTNGLGKSTLLKTLLGLIKPFSGAIEQGEFVSVGYFEQEEAKGNMNTALDELWQAYPGMTNFEVRAALASCGLTNEHITTKMTALSGGEAAKVRLAKIMQKPVNLLVLDEPTNHLDVEAKKELKRALQEYKGTLLLVSHEPDFYEDLVDTVWNIESWSTKIV